MKRYLAPTAWLLGIASTAALILSACQTTENPASNSRTEVSASSAPRPNFVGRSSGKSGSQLWAESCTRCHNDRSPASYNDAQWEVVAHHMRIRANLTAEEHTKILEFLQSAN